MFECIIMLVHFEFNFMNAAHVRSEVELCVFILGCGLLLFKKFGKQISNSLQKLLHNIRIGPL
jgi:hypothetical protein